MQVTGRDKLEEVEDFVNPQGRMSGRELRTDAHPRFHGTAGAATGNDREEASPAEIEAEKFSKEIGRYLDKARMDHRFDRLILLAPPRFLGMLRKELGKEVAKLVDEEIDRDLSWFRTDEIERYLSAGRPAR
jgi:protein required for attachment to host cells